MFDNSSNIVEILKTKRSLSHISKAQGLNATLRYLYGTYVIDFKSSLHFLFQIDFTAITHLHWKNWLDCFLSASVAALVADAYSTDDKYAVCRRTLQLTCFLHET